MKHLVMLLTTDHLHPVAYNVHRIVRFWAEETWKQVSDRTLLTCAGVEYPIVIREPFEVVEGKISEALEIAQQPTISEAQRFASLNTGLINRFVSLYGIQGEKK